MSFLNNLFGSNKRIELPVKVDMHSHLLPGIDDGAEDIEDSISLIKGLMDVGYKQFITTPHIMGDFYKNTPETILKGLDQVNRALDKEGIEVKITAAAEYYIDEWFSDLIKSNKLLTLDDHHILVETSYINKPINFREVIFSLQAKGYTVVIAHPERYTYLYHNFDLFEEMYDLNVKFQLNLNSLSGYYSPAAKKNAEKLIDKGMIDFIGTDCHAMKHVKKLEQVMTSKYFKRLSTLNLLNDQLV